MQKSIILFILVSFSISLTFAQDSSDQSHFMVGLEGRTAFAVGDFHNLTNFGAGGSLRFGYRINSAVSVFWKIAVVDFNNNTVIVTDSVSTRAETRFNVMLPVTLGVNYYFSENNLRPYGGLEAGMFLFADNLGDAITTSILTNSTIPDTGIVHFGISPTVGLQYNASQRINIDSRISYTMVFSDGLSPRWIDIGIGMEYLFGK